MAQGQAVRLRGQAGDQGGRVREEFFFLRFFFSPRSSHAFFNPGKKTLSLPSLSLPSLSLSLFSFTTTAKTSPPNHHHHHHHRPAHHHLNSSVDLCKWECRLPGKEGTEWAGGSFPLTLDFPADDFPAKPPKARFPAGFFHPNVYPSGTVCLSILNEDEGWRPSLTVRNVLMGVQELLADPNPKSPAQSDAYVLFVKEPAEYSRRVKAQTTKYPPPS